MTAAFALYRGSAKPNFSMCLRTVRAASVGFGAGRESPSARRANGPDSGPGMSPSRLRGLALGAAAVEGGVDAVLDGLLGVASPDDGTGASRAALVGKPVGEPGRDLRNGSALLDPGAPRYPV